LPRNQGEITALRIGIGDREAHKLIVEHPISSADIWFGVIGWGEYMRTAKTHKRMKIGLIFLLIITTVNGCEVDTKLIVSGLNPPIIEFEGTGGLHQLFISGPFTLEQIKGGYKISRGKGSITVEQAKELDRVYGDKHYALWQLDPDLSQNLNVSTLSITYGIVPEGWKQVYPANEKPEPLIEGKFYKVAAPSYNANFKTGYFTIKNNKAVTLTQEELGN
jgi:hypothetical protein